MAGATTVVEVVVEATATATTTAGPVATGAVTSTLRASTATLRLRAMIATAEVAIVVVEGTAAAATTGHRVGHLRTLLATAAVMQVLQATPHHRVAVATSVAATIRPAKGRVACLTTDLGRHKHSDL